MDDTAEAIILAATADSDKVKGQIFNVADDTTGTWKDFYDAVADGIGEKRVTRSIPSVLAYGLAYILENVYRYMDWYDDCRPFFTFFLLRLIAQHQVYFFLFLFLFQLHRDDKYVHASSNRITRSQRRKSRSDGNHAHRLKSEWQRRSHG